MGLLPLEFAEGEDASSLGLDGTEIYDIDLPEAPTPGQELEVRATAAGGAVSTFAVRCRLDTPVEVEYWRNGGILHTVLRKLVTGG
jgi:aconitate hydratase